MSRLQALLQIALFKTLAGEKAEGRNHKQVYRKVGKMSNNGYDYRGGGKA